MTAFASALGAEVLKVRRTRALWLALGAPLTVVLLYLLLLTTGAPASDADWTTSAQGMIGFWALLMLPLYVALETAFINAIDHDAHGWKHLFALPAPRWTVHGAKLIVALAMVGVSSVIVVAGLLGLIVGLKSFGFGASGSPVPWSVVINGGLYSYGGSLGIVAIHHGLSLRLRGFEWPIGLGIAATFFGQQVSRSADYWFVFPWSYPTVAASSSNPEWRLWAIALSAGVAVLVGLATAYDMARRDIT